MWTPDCLAGIEGQTDRFTVQLGLGCTMRKNLEEPRSRLTRSPSIGSNGSCADQLTSGDAAARKAYLSTLVDAIIVSEDNVQIVGSNDNIRSTFEPDGQPTPRVRKSVQGWCAWRDSNSCSRFVVQILSGRFALQSQYRSPRDVRPLISKDMVRPPVTGSAPSSFRKSKAVPAV